MDANGIFDHQHTLVRLLKDLNPNPKAVEVGVASGRTSEYLLRTIPGLHLTMVDSWKCPASGTKKTQADYDRAKATAVARTEFAADRRTILHMPSVDAGNRMEGLAQHQDLIFIDAHHEYESVLEDCRAWWHVLKHGGIYCGHDIDSEKDKRGVWGVRRAVEEFAKDVGRSFVVDKNTWIMVK